ncbi:hypothetical protein B9G98_04324 [Wickerhamiella sorbophila]|uniref:Uncharacterized protein n=1 Tax=Wickerhamiella sorbophila TaxID=45607 RepID=A0A2T0FNZ1_9ASCO|nr:hypothetical protein B9G98_04324 [Wickerhamiella sorbophila]PRT56704.1 hypothetical protein B9G98_04324 [Wickerhamiella sorbophila]
MPADSDRAVYSDSSMHGGTIDVEDGLPAFTTGQSPNRKYCAHIVDENGSPTYPQTLPSSDPFDFRGAEQQYDIFSKDSPAQAKRTERKMTASRPLRPHRKVVFKL